MENEKNQEKKPIYKKWWFWLIIIVVIGSFGTSSNTTHKNITNTVQNTNETIQNTSLQNQSVILSLSNSNGKDFYESLCGVTEIEEKEGTFENNITIYKEENENYKFEIKSNYNNEIISVKMEVLGDIDYDNFLIASTRMDYKNSNKALLLNWILENKGKNSTTKIGDANFKLSIGTNNKPILEIYP